MGGRIDRHRPDRGSCSPASRGGCSFGSSLLIKADCSNSLLPHWLHLHGNALASSSTWASFHLQHLRSSKPLAGSVDNQDWVQLNRLYSEPSRRALARHPELNRTVKPPAYGPQVPSCCCSVCLVARIHHLSHCSAAAGCCCEPWLGLLALLLRALAWVRLRHDPH